MQRHYILTSKPSNIANHYEEWSCSSFLSLTHSLLVSCISVVSGFVGQPLGTVQQQNGGVPVT